MIISVATAKTYMKIDSAETGYDSFLTELITEATNEIETYCGQRFEESSRTLIFDGNGTNEYIISTLPVSAVASLSYRDTPFDSWTAISSSDYTTLKSGGVTSLFYNGTLIEGRQNYKVVATIGYASNAIPAEINAVLKEMVAVKFDESPNGAARLAKLGTSRTIDGFATNETFENLRPKWHKRLKNYRRIPV